MSTTITNPWRSVLSNPDEYGRALSERNATLNAFLEIDSARHAATASGSDAEPGVPIAVKDNIAVRGFRLTCASRMLANFVSPYDATVVARLAAAGYRPVGKTNLDEFGMGSSTDNSAFGPTNNPWDPERVAGGSSGGSAAAVAAGMVPVALGTDTGGSVRQPAAFCGVYGLKPTYGTLSRYGLVAYASSLEVAGILAESVDLIDDVFLSASGIDPLDQTSTHTDSPPHAEVRRVAFLSGDLGLDTRTAAGYARMRDAVAAGGAQIVDVELSTGDYAVPAYYTIATAEASANLARFNGVRYGERPPYAENPEQLVRTARSQGFGSEVKLRILLGTYVLRSGFQEQYYQRAQKIRTAIRREFDSLFASYDLLVLPVYPTTAFRHGASELDPFQQKMADKFTTLANLAALPALSIPVGVYDGLPVGIQAMGPAFSESRLIEFARRLSSDLPFERPPGFAPLAGGAI